MIAIAVTLAFAFGLGLPGKALAARSDWSHADQSQMRLLLGAPTSGKLVGGLEMLIDPGWYTYWRDPGEAGIPPVFDFSASTNVASVEVLYPAPERHDDGASVSLVYRNEVVFPLVILPERMGEPVVLRVAARFGVCSDICVPTQAESEVAASTESDPLADARLAQFLPRVPVAPRAGHFAIESVSMEEGDALLIDVRTPESSYLDLFADAPEGWHIGQPEFLSRGENVSRYRLPLAGGPDAAARKGQAIRFVAVAGSEAIEETVEIR